MSSKFIKEKFIEDTIEIRIKDNSNSIRVEHKFDRALSLSEEELRKELNKAIEVLIRRKYETDSE